MATPPTRTAGGLSYTPGCVSKAASRPDAAYDEARRVATGIRRRVDLTPWMEASA